MCLADAHYRVHVRGLFFPGVLLLLLFFLNDYLFTCLCREGSRFHPMEPIFRLTQLIHREIQRERENGSTAQ